MVNAATNMTVEVCEALHSQLGPLFECSASGERVQIRTPFVLPDGHQIDVYWRDTQWGQVVSDLGDTHGWLFMNAAKDLAVSAQDQMYTIVCETYGVERLDVALLARVTDGDLANAVIRLAQAITAVSYSLDEEQTRRIADQDDFKIPRVVDAPTVRPSTVPAVAYERVARSDAVPDFKRLTGTRIERALTSGGLAYRRKVKFTGGTSNTWTLDYLVSTEHSDAALMALHGRVHEGWQRRAAGHAFSAFSDLSPTFREFDHPVKAISVVDDNDHDWYEEPIQLISTISEVVYLSDRGSLVVAILGDSARSPE